MTPLRLGIAMLLSSLVAAQCPTGFEPPALSDLTRPSDPALLSTYAVIAARLGSLGGLDDVFTHDCEIRLNEGPPYKTALGENATWHGALAHAITITLREKNKEATIPNIWSLLSLNKIRSWATTADPTGEQPHSVKDADAFNEVLGQAQPKGIVMQWDVPELSYSTVISWDVTTKSGKLQDWMTLNTSGDIQAASPDPNVNLELYQMWNDQLRPTNIWIPADKGSA
ncbi:hypothetical protein FFLO_02844 [Filobasidium floriforme]|uniref:Uncharacterized protein n=1 Tax=Filobasidium floriforme TaxID=5210 RepID=A0A8K0JN72_9TREE|nr:uncharacterized protein HD553DRAFT_348386 [Filobasidium floriforme]KAG7558191.1 hypothetical protein FFLO_02844 [Filobasidium floriforme]KAH8088541.1 hypothetical protein HD553DRAFT_348386 [Filobasidium floriforme]